MGGGEPFRAVSHRPRVWTLECLMAARMLIAAGAPLGHVAFALDRTSGDVDRALWTLVGRTPGQALQVLGA